MTDELKPQELETFQNALKELDAMTKYPHLKKQLSTETLLIAIAAIHEIVNRPAAPENKPLTNFDHIAASPESLAKFLQNLSNISFDNVFCHAQCDDDDNCPHELQCIVDWLNRPYKQEGSEP